MDSKKLRKLRKLAEAARETFGGGAWVIGNPTRLQWVVRVAHRDWRVAVEPRPPYAVENWRPIGEYIAAVDPDTLLALLDQLEARLAATKVGVGIFFLGLFSLGAIELAFAEAQTFRRHF